MRVAPLFEGDDDDAAARKQSEVYVEALRTIVWTCNRYARFARHVLNSSDKLDWGPVEEVDARPLQVAHDLLAAAWRFHHNTRQEEMFRARDSIDEVQTSWLRWLVQEVESWTDAPWLVRYVQLILLNQNGSLGDEAQWRLGYAILSRFEFVPWSSTLRESYEKAVDRLDGSG